jgi:hypothetical protein
VPLEISRAQVSVQTKGRESGAPGGDPEARAADVKTADAWVERTMEIKKAKAEQAHAGQQ